MKNVLVVCSIVFILVSTGCRFLEEKPQDIRTEKNLIVIVKDRSESIQTNRRTVKAEKRMLQQQLQQQVTPHTDIALLEVNSHSGARTNARWVRYVAPKKHTSHRVQSQKEEALQESMYHNKERRVLKKMVRKALGHVYDVSETASSQTALLEVLFPMSEIAKAYDTVQVIFVSDMIQESAFQNFTQQQWPMPSKSYAMTLAKKDAEKLTQQGFTIDLSKFKRITILVPAQANSRYFVNMPFYWDTLFQTQHYQNTVSWEKVRN